LRKSLFLYLFLITLLFVPFLNLNVYATTAKFGYETKGSTEVTILSGWIEGSRFACSQEGTALSITWYIKGTNGLKCKFALYKVSNNVLVAYTEEFTVSGSYNNWKTLNVVWGGTLEITNYWIAIWTSGTFYCYQASHTYNFYYQTKTYNGFPNPWTPSDSYSAKKFSSYCTYTVSGGGETFKLSASTNLIFTLNNLPKFYGTHFVSSSINVKFNVYPIVNRFGTFNVYPSINIRFDSSSRIQQYLGNVYNIFSSTNLIFHTSSNTRFFGFYHISPSINVKFNINSITQISGVIHRILPSITLTFDISKTQDFWGTYIINPHIIIKFNLPTSLSGGILKGYEISDAILLAVLAFIISMIAIVLAVALRH
jgi:hypothetical protein